MRRHRLTIALLVAALLLPTAPGVATAQPSPDPIRLLSPSDVPAPPADPDPWIGSGHLRRWTGEPGWVAGRSVYDRGELIHTDFVYDDTGAGTRANYPQDWEAYLDNAADIAEVRIAREAGATLLRVTLNSLARPDGTVLGIGLGHAGDPGGGPWPLGAGVAVPPSIGTVVTAVGDRMVVHDVASGDRVDDPPGAVVVTDVETNTVEVRLPDDVFAPDEAFTAVVTSGLWDHDDEAWMPITATMGSATAASGGQTGDPAVFNVAFRAGEDPYARSNEQVRANDGVQGAALAEGDVSAFVTTVDRTKLEHEVSEPLDLAELSGTAIRTYRSAADLGEGILNLAGDPCWTVANDCVAVWRGRFVPYLIDVPEVFDGSPVGLIYTGHGAGDNHTQNETNVDRTQHFRDELGTIVVGNSGRGKGSLYQRHGELDQLEVLADVARHYPIDADHIIKMGESMGGIGTYIFGMRTPDLARAIVPLDGVAMWNAQPTTNEAIVGEYTGDTYVFETLVPNLTNTPVHAEAAFGDPLVRWDLAYQQHVLPLEELGGRVDHYVCQGTHITQWALSTRWVNFIDAELRAPARPVPSRVRYATDPIQQALSQEYGVDARQAWWVDGILPRDEAVSALDLRTSTLPTTEPAALVDADEVVPTHPDDGGLGPCNRTAQLWEGTVDRPIENRIEGTVQNLQALTLDLDVLDVAPAPLTLVLESDGPTRVRLTPLSAADVRIDGGQPLALPSDGAGVVLELQEGLHTYEIAPGLVSRQAGPTRIETAVAVSSLGVESADTVVLARADDYPDALAGGPLAVHLEAPLLLTAPDGLSEAVAAEIRRLDATEVVLLGGEQALSPQVAADVEALDVAVRRIAGPSRWATAAAIAAELPATGEVLLVRGDAFPDALSASGFGAGTATPVLLTEPDRLPAETAEALTAATDVTVIGGTAAVSESVTAQVDAAAGTVTRLSGDTRYGTSAAVADAALARGITPSVVWLATGADFPDALVAGAAAGRDQGVLLLVDGTDLAGSPETRDWLAVHAADIDEIRIAGGTAAISDTVQAGLEA